MQAKTQIRSKASRAAAHPVLTLAGARREAAIDSRGCVRRFIHALPLRAHLAAMLAMLLLLLAVAQSARAQSDCLGAEYNAACGANGACVFHPSPGAGCAENSGACQNCHRAIIQALMPGSEIARTLDLSTQFAGVFRRNRFVITNPGPLERLGVKRGDVIKRINGWRVTERRLHNLLYRKHDALRLDFYTPRGRVIHRATIRPVVK